VVKLDDAKIYTTGDGKRVNRSEMIVSIANYILQDTDAEYEITI
jgi:hypothetical protein